MDEATFKILSLVLGSVTAIGIFLLGAYITRINKNIDTCVEDTKGCNKSIAQLAILAGKTDTTVEQMGRRMDGFSEKIHNLTHKVIELETREAVRIGHD